MGQTRILRALILGLLAAALSGCFSQVARRNDDAAAVIAAKQRQLASESNAVPTNAQQPPPSSSYQAHTPNTASETTASTQQPDEAVPYDIWDRIRAGMSIPPVDNAQVDSQIKWFEHHQKFLDRVVDRAQPYLHYIVEEIDKRGMPMELALLPVVESAYQPFAYSSGHASGLWQFTSGTGKRFGLEQNWWYDGRRDVAQSTRAALDYLQLLHDEFKGHWLAAIAAYNCGEANVQRAIDENKKAGKPTDFWHLDLPAETEGYVPRLLALAAIVARPAQYSITLKSIPNRPYLASVDINGQVDLTKAARVAGLSQATLFKLNPGFNRTVTGPHSSHSILVPIDRAMRLAEAVDKLAPAKIQHGWRKYQVHRGDTLSTIASHHHVRVAALRSMNHLKGTMIRAGHDILVPAPVPPGNPLLAAADLPAFEGGHHRSSGEKITHVVRSGDNLWTIARSYRVTVKSLCAWNRISPHSRLHPGQKLVIWRNTRVASTARRHEQHVTRLAEADPPPATGQAKVAHVVRSGDSLWTIARSYNVSVRELCAWNDISPHSRLHPGQKLVIWRNTRVASTARRHGHRVTRLAEADPPPAVGQAKVAHVVHSGDSLWTIARSYNVSVRELCAWNGIRRHTTLRPGQKLVIRRGGTQPTVPAAEEASSAGRFLHTASADGDGREHIHYEVRKGDSLWLISQRFSVTVAQLCKWNGLSKSDTLQPGQSLDVYVEDLRQTDASNAALRDAQTNQG